ncbi:RNA polymerase recycling motor ATPase HelR [Actinosynnema mirum]|uniref:Superfamily I DNA and RNA helicase-like protein n=1 Tax=Actinosynnema mirum (strain ATCC 29888 / DSM 43827 / JCM 3225 / NBRC 14064 / NCIMB 13271 / NRRL B-12336 / IMRU 3971 / 101) TaxID=446462 RepID=C6WS54_ACTMD|nr:RNA polymerase recycling motor ATPase HelR [Actinosynnema mirum]ACU38874.1 superfamily I DNA and RNA helicase-like protein [Actinosynnema mirum DSM 43827]
MAARGYEEELDAERAHVAELYARLDAERARVRTEYDNALMGNGGNSGSLVERDTEVRSLGREVKRLDVADNGLCFGRLDAITGERSYIGRIGLYDKDDDYEPALLDWRAPAARPFYVATAANPEGMRRRRQFHTRGRRIVDYTDEVLGRPGDQERGDAALLAAVNAPRGEGMRDIVATIQAEQDRIIRLAHDGVLVIEGGPGTGKTVVALHRVAYLMYTQRERMERHGVLVVGPNPAFLNHIGRVLPSLGESDVVFTTTGGFVPGLVVTAEEQDPEAARVKGSLKFLEVLAAAVADRQTLPEEPLEVRMGGHDLLLGRDVVEWARQEARDSGLPHNEARSTFTEILTYVLTERAIARIGKGWLTRDNKDAWERTRRELLKELADDDSFTALVDRFWPRLTPASLLAGLYSSPERLRAAGADVGLLLRERGNAWTVSDVPLLDELVDLLGRDRADDAAAEAARDREAKFAEGVLGMLVERADMMDDEDHLIASDLVDASDLAERFEERDTRDLVERASADRDWTYRHVVVDEAQELSEMDWRVLMRRCPNRSFTVVGDLAQRRSPAGADSWGAVLDRYVPGRWVYRELTVNYRTPAEIMAVAASVLAGFAPSVRPPESVRSCGVPPWARRVPPEQVAEAVAEFTRAEAGREGTSVVIGPPDVPGAVAASETKGLEYDAVLVVEPERILADGDRGAAELYVALTRATQRLGVLHTAPLPESLSGLVEVEDPLTAR